MEPAEQEKPALVQDLEADARAEAQEILKTAEAQVADKREFGRRQVESLLNDARAKAQEQAEAIRKKAIRAAQREVKRRSMRRKAAVVQDVMERVEKRMAAMIDDAGYRSALVNWVAEAAIGLGAESAEVNASEKERARIDAQLLSEGAAKAHAATSQQVALTLSASPPLPAQGVVLTAADGRTAFNNQVRTRILRNQRKIHRLIHDCLFAEHREE